MDGSRGSWSRRRRQRKWGGRSRGRGRAGGVGKSRNVAALAAKAYTVDCFVFTTKALDPSATVGGDLAFAVMHNATGPDFVSIVVALTN